LLLDERLGQREVVAGEKLIEHLLFGLAFERVLLAVGGALAELGFEVGPGLVGS
jgi:hypothetical protein